MFWASPEVPRSGFDVAADSLIDGGHPERSHRVGISDNDFREDGVQVAQTPLGEFVFLLRFADHFRPRVSNSDGAKLAEYAQWTPGMHLREPRGSATSRQRLKNFRPEVPIPA